MEVLKRLAPGELRADVVVIDGSVRVLVAGELDVHTGPALSEACLPALDQVPPGGELVIDLSALAFVDAAGLGTLVRLGNLLGAAGRRLQVKADCPTIRRVFHITQLEMLLSDPVGSGVRPRPEGG